MGQPRQYAGRISTHALREEGDLADAATRPRRHKRFLPTPSARRATGGQKDVLTIFGNFYPRPPRGGRPEDCSRVSPFGNFYPRPPRGGRRGNFPVRKKEKQFLPTPSARRATGFGPAGNWPVYYFYPRPPRGGRLRRRGAARLVVAISTHALREEGDTHDIA